MSTNPVPPSTIPKTGPGSLNLDALEALEADIAAREEAKATRRKQRAERVEQAGVTQQALNMRERRQRPDVQRQERKALKARDEARRILARRHPDEYITIVQECRAALGLEPLRPRSVRHTPPTEQHVTPQAPAQLQEQEQCRHGDYPIKKLPYGKFCSNCGRKL